MEAKIIAICMEKGGVGKTTSSINIASALADMGKKVLLVDIDPQGDLAKALQQRENVKETITNLLFAIIDEQDFDPNRALIKIDGNLHLMPSNRKIVGVQNRLMTELANKSFFNDPNELSGERVLKKLLDSLRNDYDYILIDCPPSLSILTINALVASNTVLLPVEGQILSYYDIAETIEIIMNVQKNYNPDLKIEGVLLTKFQGSTKVGKVVKNALKETYGDVLKVFKSYIPYAIRLAEQPEFGVSILELEPNSKAANAYVSVAEELVSHV